MNREALDRSCERGILALVLSILISGPLAYGGSGTAPFLVLQWLTVAVLILWGIRLWVSPRLQLLWPPICWAVIAFTIYVVVRYLTSDIEYVARQELVRIVVYASLFFIILNNLYRKDAAQWISLATIFLAMLIASYALYQFLTHSKHILAFLAPDPGRGSGTFVSPNHLGGFLEMLLPLALAFTLASRLKPVPKIFVGYAGLVMIAGIASTLSRGTWISAGLSLLIFFGVLTSQRPYRLPAILLLGCIIAGCVLLVPRSHLFERRVHDLYQEGTVNDDGRFNIWQSAVQVWEQNVWWGAGPGHFDYRFPGYRTETNQLQPRRAHNDYLNTLADLGLAGTLLVTSAWVMLGAGLIKTWPFVRPVPGDLGGRSSGNRFALTLGASCGLIAILFHSVVDFNMHIPANAILVITLMALLSSQLRFASERYWITVRPWMKALASAVVLGTALYLGYQGWRHTLEYTWLHRAGEAPSFSVEQARRLERAFQIEPRNAETAYHIGECYRHQSQEGGRFYGDQTGVDYQQLAEKAMPWFDRAVMLNPWCTEAFLGYGWCLDWVDRTAESASYFSKAEELDPNGFNTLANIGVHYVELGDFAAARAYFERSLRLERARNPIAVSYFQIVNNQLLASATNNLPATAPLTPP